MTTTSRITLVTFIALCWLSVPAFADRYSLQQAVAYALENNPSLSGAHEQVLAATARIASARSGALPQVQASLAASYSNNPLDVFATKLNTSEVTAQDFDPAKLNNPSASSLMIGELSVRMPVYDGGRVDAQVRSASSSQRATQLQYDQQRDFIAYSTEQAFLAAITATQAVGISEEGVRAAQEHANTTTQLVREGRIIQSDQLTAELNLSTMQSIREQAKSRQRQALAELKWTMGLPQDTVIEVTSSSDDKQTSASPALAAQVEKAKTQRKDLLALQTQMDALRAEVDAARAGKRIQFNVMAAGDTYQNGGEIDNTAWRVMGIVSMPLYEGGYSNHQVDAAQRQVNATNASVNSLEQRIASEIQIAFDGVIEGQARLDIANGNVDKAQRNVALIKQRYGQGRTILIDLLQAERMLVDARNEALYARYQLQKHLSSLRFAVGESLSSTQGTH